MLVPTLRPPQVEKIPSPAEFLRCLGGRGNVKDLEDNETFDRDFNPHTQDGDVRDGHLHEDEPLDGVSRG